MVEEQNRITPEILKKAVAKEFSTKEDEIEIIEHNVSPGAAVGDNFATVVKRVDFSYKLNEEVHAHSYIYKEVPHNEFREKFVRGVSTKYLISMTTNEKYHHINIKKVNINVS